MVKNPILIPKPKCPILIFLADEESMKLHEEKVLYSSADVDNQSSLSESRSCSSTLRGHADDCDNVFNNEDDEESMPIDEALSINDMESKSLVPEESNQLDNANLSAVNSDPCLKNGVSSGSLDDIESQEDSNVERMKEVDMDVSGQQGQKSEADAITGKLNTFE